MIPPSRPSASWSQVVGSHGFSAERDAAPSLSFVRLLKGKKFLFFGHRGKRATDGNLE